MRHMSTRALARYSAGAFGLRKAARITAHLAGCPRCSGTSNDLTSVSDLLAKMAPTAMPAAIADRLARAIASESASRTAHRSAASGMASVGVAEAATWTEPGGPDRAVPGRPDLPARRRHAASPRRRPVLSSPVVLRGLAAAAAVVIVAGAGYLFTNRTSTTSPAARRAAHIAGPKGTYSGAQGAGSPSGPLSIQYGPVAAGPTSPGAVQAVHTAPVLRSGINYTTANLAAQVHESVASTAPQRAERFSTNAISSPVPQASPRNLAVLAYGLTESRLASCLSGIAQGRRILVADVARYLGKPATIIVLTSLTSVNVLDVIIVGLACSATHAHEITSTTVPRH
jgi:hypothetical protein